MRHNYFRNWSIPQSLLWFIIALVVGVGSLSGMVLPGASSQITVGPYQLAAFPSGFAIFMDSESWHYAISPLNDYAIDSQGKRFALLSSDDFSRNNYTNSTDDFSLFRILESAGAQLGIRTPRYSFSAKPFSATYLSDQGKNKIKITRWLTLPQDTQFNEVGITLKFNPDDFIYEAGSKSLFTEKDVTEIDQFSQVTGLKLVDIANQMRKTLGLGTNLPRHPVEGKEVIIANLAYPGALKVLAEPGQVIYINPDNTSIELTHTLSRPHTEHISTSITIEYIPLLENTKL